MKHSAHVGLTAWLAAGMAIADSAPLRYVPSRQVVVEYRPAGVAEVTEAELWVSADSGRTWQPAATAHDGQHALSYNAPGDGRYDFYVVLRNDAGASAEPPQPGSTPVLTAIVDTVPPLFQIHSAGTEPGQDGRPILALQATLVEENLSATGIRVFYRTADQSWLDGGTAQRSDSRLVWPLPETAGSPCDLRVVVTDLAGNQSSADVLDVPIPRPSAAQGPATSQESREGVPPPQPVTVATIASPATTPKAVDTSELRRLRSLAAGFMSAAQYPLAAARLEDALALSPNEPDLLVDLGSALYRMGRYEDAEARFQSALGVLPDHAAAIEGLALVAATQKRYAQARQYMQQLQRLQPGCGLVWLRSGDIEHRLGNTTAALDAWERALTAEDAGKDLRDKARRRLDYFGPGHTRIETPRSSTDQWQEAPQPRRSSSSTETNNTRSSPP
jgi:hypothetical protein